MEGGHAGLQPPAAAAAHRWRRPSRWFGCPWRRTGGKWRPGGTTTCPARPWHARGTPCGRQQARQQAWVGAPGHPRGPAAGGRSAARTACAAHRTGDTELRRSHSCSAGAMSSSDATMSCVATSGFHCIALHRLRPEGSLNDTTGRCFFRSHTTTASVGWDGMGWREGEGRRRGQVGRQMRRRHWVRIGWPRATQQSTRQRRRRRRTRAGRGAGAQDVLHLAVPRQMRDLRLWPRCRRAGRAARGGGTSATCYRACWALCRHPGMRRCLCRKQHPPAPPFMAGYSEGCAGLPTSHTHSSPSAPPDASRLGLRRQRGGNEGGVRGQLAALWGCRHGRLPLLRSSQAAAAAQCSCIPPRRHPTAAPHSDT